MRKGPAILAGLAVAALLPAACTVRQVEGGSVYADYCTSCHGVTGRGDGPAAADLARRPPNLTTIAARNGGTFPMAQVMSTIDGYTRGLNRRADVMPEFGELLRGRKVLYDSGDGIPTPTPEKLVALAEYLRAIQR